MKLIKYLFLGLIVISSLSSCEEKGCTDPNAVNYDITANQDDGSCIVCQTNTILYDSMDLPLVDKRGSSIYYNDTVGVFHLVQYLEYPNDRVCGNDKSYTTLYLQNLINQDLQVTFSIQEVTGPINIYAGGTAYVGSLETYEHGIISNVNFPPFHKISLDSLSLTLTGYILYY